MDAAIGLDDVAHFSDLQGEGGIFERLLHLSSTKNTKIPAFASRAAVGVLFCELCELVVGSVDLGLVSLEDLNRLGL